MWGGMGQAWQTPELSWQRAGSARLRKMEHLLTAVTAQLLTHRPVSSTVAFRWSQRAGGAIWQSGHCLE